MCIYASQRTGIHRIDPWKELTRRHNLMCITLAAHHLQQIGTGNAAPLVWDLTRSQ